MHVCLVLRHIQSSNIRKVVYFVGLFISHPYTCVTDINRNETNTSNLEL